MGGGGGEAAITKVKRSLNIYLRSVERWSISLYIIMIVIVVQDCSSSGSKSENLQFCVYIAFLLMQLTTLLTKQKLLLGWIQKKIKKREQILKIEQF